MSTDRDTTRIVRSWLRDDEHQSADRVLDAVLDRLDTTPQRRTTWWPARRTSDMNKFVVLGVAAAAVLLIVFIGVQLTGTPNLGGLLPTPAVTESPQPDSPTPSPTDPTAGFPSSGLVPVGRHSMIVGGVPLSIEVANTGWTAQGGFRMYRNAGVSAFIFWTGGTPDRVYSDPCAGVEGPIMGSDIAALAAAVAAVPGTDLVAGPTDMTIGGRPAQHVVLTVREDVACGAGGEGMLLWGNEDGGRWPDALGDEIRVWIIDSGDGVVWIDAETPPGQTDVAQEMEQIVESIEFE